MIVPGAPPGPGEPAVPGRAAPGSPGSCRSDAAYTRDTSIDWSISMMGMPSRTG